MATQIQLRRGTATQNNAFTGAVGEVTADTTNNKLRLHDGSTAGGHEIGGTGDISFSSNEILTTDDQMVFKIDSDNNETGYEGYYFYGGPVSNGNVRFWVNGGAVETAVKFSTSSTYSAFLQKSNEFKFIFNEHAGNHPVQLSNYGNGSSAHINLGVRHADARVRVTDHNNNLFYALPRATPSTGEVLTASDGSGSLTWSAPAGGLDNFTEGVSTSSPHSASSGAVKLEASGTPARLDVYLHPKDDGALVNGSESDGNKRGVFAVDWQATRNNADEVASGGRSSILGGSSNKASANWSTSVGGRENTASGVYSFLGGGYQGTSTGDSSTTAGGYSNDATSSYSTIGGGFSNTASSTSATVGGGEICTASGQRSTVAGGDQNTASGSRAAVGGGGQNTASGLYSNISGGLSGSASGEYATVSGGQSNIASGQKSFVGGGKSNTATDTTTVVAGGEGNDATSARSTICGGMNNAASANVATVVGGSDNTASGEYGFVGGGTYITSSGTYSAIAGGQGNTASSEHSFVGGGQTNEAKTNTHATVVGGQNNDATGTQSFVGGGYGNTASGSPSTVCGGSSNTASSSYSFVGGGDSNEAKTNNYATVVGGKSNDATGSYSFVGGGQTNQATGDRSTVGGGISNKATNDMATVGGGNANDATAAESTVAGGSYNDATGSKSFIGGGGSNDATAQFSTVAGGSTNKATGLYTSVVGGLDNRADADYATVLGGSYGDTRGTIGKTVFAASGSPIGTFHGYSQAGLLIVGATTHDATTTTLRSNQNSASASNQCVLENGGSLFAFTVTVVGREISTGHYACIKFEGVIDKQGSLDNVTIRTTPTKTTLGTNGDGSNWDAEVDADTTNQALRVKVTGEASTTIRWVAKVETTELGL